MFLLHGYHRLHPWWEYTDLSPLSQPCLGSRSASNATQWESRSKVKSITISRHQISNKHVLKWRERKNRERLYNTKIQTAAHEASNFQPPGKAWQISAALTAFPQPLGYDPNWKRVANRDRPWSAFIWPSLDLLEWVHRRAMKMITGLESHEDRLTEFSLQRRRLEEDLIAPSST